LLTDHPTTPETYTLSLHDALPIWRRSKSSAHRRPWPSRDEGENRQQQRSEKNDVQRNQRRVAPARHHHHEGQSDQAGDRPCRTLDRKSTRLNSRSLAYLVCRLLLE